MAKHSYQHAKKMSWLSIILSCSMFAGYAFVIGNDKAGGDRGNYALRFVEGWDVSKESVGLNWAYETLRPISLDPDFLFITFEFAYIFISLVAYRYYKQATPRGLLLVLSSLYPLFGCYAIKQAISQALVTLALVVYFNQDGKTFCKSLFPYFLCSMLVLGGIVFHEAALFVLFFFVLFLFWNSGILHTLCYIVIAVTLLAFPVFQAYLFDNIGFYSADLESQIESYSNGLGVDSSALTIVKGLPLYIITYVGIRFRSQYKHTIPCYDKLLLFAVVSSYFVLISVYNYWYFRFALYFSLFVYTFATMLRNKQQELGLSTKWYKWTYIITLLLTLKEITQIYFLYGGL